MDIRSLKCGFLLAFAVSTGWAQTRPGWTLAWSDEFDGTAIDSSKWTYDTGGNGWGNNELEYYTSRPENSYLENGNLVIKAIREAYGNRQYTSARMLTKGKFAQAYGRFEARIKIPFGQGIWPAFWLLGQDIDTPGIGWPACGEIDVMENIGKEPAIVHGTVHGPGYSGGNGIGAAYTLSSGRFADDYHVYALEWEPAALRFYVDDQLYKTVTPANLPSGARWVYDHPFFILLNMAVGGNWPGVPDSTTQFPQYMYVDYVRVYQAAKPAIRSNGTVNGASFEAGIAPGSWASITGTGLSRTERLWRDADFAGDDLPTQMDGVSISVNGKPAYVEYVSNGQINFQVPDIGAGPATIQVTNNGQVSDTVQADVRTWQPAFFQWGTYAVATRPDYSLVGKPGMFVELNTTPAKPGEIIILWGTGFGPTDPPLPAGRIVRAANKLATDPTVRIGGVPARYIGGALSPGYVGLYQIAVEVPANTPDGDVTITAEMAGAASPQSVYLTVAR